MDDKEALIALNMIPHVGPVRLRNLQDRIGPPAAILGAARDQLLRVPGIGEAAADAIVGWEKSIDLAGELKRIAEFGCQVVTWTDGEYPELLKQIYDPPIVLYVKGQLSPRDKNSVAIVGSRMTTHYGINVARKLSYQLAYVGVTVVSGGARGIDTAAHQGALNAKGRTIAVPGSVDSPRSKGCHDLIKKGAKLCESAEDILSEFEYLFPASNRPASPAETGVLPALELGEPEQLVYGVLSHNEISIDDVIERAGLPASAASVALLSLEMKRLVRQLPGRRYVRNQ